MPSYYRIEIDFKVFLFGPSHLIIEFEPSNESNHSIVKVGSEVICFPDNEHV